MKKLLSAVCILAMTAMTLAGCGSSSTRRRRQRRQNHDRFRRHLKHQGARSKGAKADGSYTVGIIQLIENGAFNDMREGFIEELQAKGYTEDKLTVDYKSAQGDGVTFKTIAPVWQAAIIVWFVQLLHRPHRQYSIFETDTRCIYRCFST